MASRLSGLSVFWVSNKLLSGGNLQQIDVEESGGLCYLFLSVPFHPFFHFLLLFIAVFCIVLIILRVDKKKLTTLWSDTLGVEKVFPRRHKRVNDYKTFICLTTPNVHTKYLPVTLKSKLDFIMVIMIMIIINYYD